MRVHEMESGQAAEVLALAMCDEFRLLPDKVQADVLAFVEGEILDGDLVRPFWEDVAMEFADGCVSVYTSERLELFADRDLRRFCEDGLDEVGAPTYDGDLSHFVAECVAVGYVAALTDVLRCLLDNLAPEWLLGSLDLTKAEEETAAALWPEWSGSLAELLAAAVALTSEAVAA